MSTLGLPSGRVVGRVVAGVLDTFDLGFEQNNEPLQGTVTFTCSAPYVAVPNGNPKPALVRMLAYEVPLNELGYLTWQGNQYVMLPVATPDTNPSAWTWRVSFDLTYEGERVTYPEFQIAVGEYIPGDESTVTDLAKAVTVPGDSGEWISKGDPGRDGDSIEDVELEGTDLVFEFKREGVTDYKYVSVPALIVATSAAQSALESMNAAGDYAGVAGAAASVATTKAEEAAASAEEASNYVGGVADNTVSTAKLQARAVTGAKIAIETILGENIAAGTLNGGFHFNPGTVPQDRLHGTGPFTDMLAGKADLSGGKLLTSQLPDLAIAEFKGAVANQAAMLEISAERGDWVQRSDTGTIWIVVAEPTSNLASWRQFSYPASPVTSVAGRTGAITLAPADITGTAVVTNDARLSNTRTSPDNSVTTAQIIDLNVTLAKLSNAAKAEGINYDHTVTGARAAGLGDLGTDGFEFPYAMTVQSFKAKFGTADASGSTVVRILKNGTQVGTDITIAAPNLTGSISGTFVFAAGDVLTVQIVSVGTTPGNKLKVVAAGIRS